MNYELNMIDIIWKLDFLLKVCWFLICNWFSWLVIMYKVIDGDYLGKLFVVFLLMIDMNFSDFICINLIFNFIGKYVKV